MAAGGGRVCGEAACALLRGSARPPETRAAPGQFMPPPWSDAELDAARGASLAAAAALMVSGWGSRVCGSRETNTTNEA